jgi:hypothetical protein
VGHSHYVHLQVMTGGIAVIPSQLLPLTGPDL